MAVLTSQRQEKSLSRVQVREIKEKSEVKNFKMARRSKTALIIVLDVGDSMGKEDCAGKSRLATAKDLALLEVKNLMRQGKLYLFTLASVILFHHPKVVFLPGQSCLCPHFTINRWKTGRGRRCALWNRGECIV